MRSYAPPAALLGEKSLAAVCAYYNPLGYRSRLRNYQTFAGRFDGFRVPLLTVELAMGPRARFELEPARGVLQVESRDVLWQKERLLNLGIARLLADGYENIAWLDADVELEDPFWPERTVAALAERPLCQLFADAVRRRADGSARDVRRGVVAELHRSGAIRLDGLACGYGWAARASLLRECPLYDAAILGGGDAAIWLAAIRSTPGWQRAVDVISFYRNMGPALKSHYLAWAERFGELVGGRVGFVDQALYADYHGPPGRRFLRSRYRWIKAFDPSRDLKYNAGQTWEWNRDGSVPRFATTIERYFETRREDD